MTAKISVIMGSTSDWETMKEACQILDEFGVSYEKKVVSAHRTPDLMFEYAQNARKKGIKIIIAGAGGAAHLPGMVASKTTLPVIGVPVQSRTLNGLVQKQTGRSLRVTFNYRYAPIGKAGAINAGLLAIQMLSMYDLELEAKLAERRSMLAKTVIESSDQLG
ncbi:N5-carboxyaminoimidazole ribonucleotide mutase [Enterococcus faecium]|nr:N5-carboxyaminoimidazole ribonucleotide mutase [Enterococcus faecium]